MADLKKIDSVAILAGKGWLPRHVYTSCLEKDIKCEVIGLEGQISEELFEDVKYDVFPLHAVSKILKKIRSLDIKHIVLAGAVKRTIVTKLLLDTKGPKLLAMIMKAGISDNTILSTVLEFLEKEGFIIVSPEQIADSLIVKKGHLTDMKPDKGAVADIKKGISILKAIANFDVGQALVIQNGLVLGVEAAEGTDELIKRCGKIQQKDDERCVLVKACKPMQDRRVDLPCIGAHTIIHLKENNFKGIAIEAGSALILDKETTMNEANKLGIFIYGVSNNQPFESS